MIVPPLKLDQTYFLICLSMINVNLYNTLIHITVDFEYTCNNIGCNEISAVAKIFSGTIFFFSKQLY